MQSKRSRGIVDLPWKLLLVCLFLAPWTNAFFQKAAYQAARRLVTSNSWSPQADDFDNFWPIPMSSAFSSSGKLEDTPKSFDTGSLPFPNDDITLSEHTPSSPIERMMKKSAKLIGMKSIHAKKTVSDTASKQDVRSLIADSSIDFASTLVAVVLAEVHPSLEGLTSVDDLRVAITGVLQNATHTALATEKEEIDLQNLLSSVQISLTPKPAVAASFLVRNALIPVVTHRAVSSVVDRVVDTCEAVEGVIHCPSTHSHFFDAVSQIMHILPSVPPS